MRTHGMHGAHGIIGISLHFMLATGAGEAETKTIPTAEAGVAAPRCTVGQGVMTNAVKECGGNRDFEFPQRVNAVRRVGPQSWQIDGSHRIDAQDVPEIFGTATYTLTRDRLALTRAGETSKWVRCR